MPRKNPYSIFFFFFVLNSRFFFKGSITKGANFISSNLTHTAKYEFKG